MKDNHQFSGKRCSWWNWFKSRFLPATKHDLEKHTEIILMKAAEVVSLVTNLTDQVNKIKVEVEKLQDAIDNSADEVPQAVVDAMGGLQAAIQGVDDLNPDAAPPPPPEA